jgi:acetyl/propionyl-CoA carboxylase alpha subunit
MEVFRAAHHTLATADVVSVPREPSASLAHLASALLPEESTGSAWESAGPFRIVSPATLAIHDIDGGWSKRVEYQRREGGWEPTLADALPEIDSPAVVIDTDDGFEVNDATGRWLMRLGPLARARADEEQADGALRAPMPGTVVAVNVTPGQAVSEGEVLAVMTAMKMEMTLAAPFHGVVAGVGCAVGDLVSSRQVLVTVTPHDESEAAGG